MATTEPNRDSLFKRREKSSRFVIPRNLVAVIGSVVVIGAIAAVVIQVMFYPKKQHQDTQLAELSHNTVTQAPSSKPLDDLLQRQEAGQDTANYKPDSLSTTRATAAGSSNPTMPGSAIKLPWQAGTAPANPATPNSQGQVARADSNVAGVGNVHGDQNAKGQAPQVSSPRGPTKTGMPPAVAGAEPPPLQPGAAARIDEAERTISLRSAPIIAQLESGGADNQQAGGQGQFPQQSNSQEQDQAGIRRQIELNQAMLEQRQRDSQRHDPTSADILQQLGKKQDGKKSESDWLSETAKYGKTHEVARGYTPPSRFMLLQGAVLNAVLETALNTDLPGDVKARVMMDVYDSINGTNLLVPKGTLLVGKYNSDIRPGQERINVAFQRMILPNGVSVDMPADQGTMGDGSTGIAGDLNNHYFAMLGVSVLTGLGAYVTQMQQYAGSGTTINTGNYAGMNAAGQIFTDMDQAVISRNATIKPTITVPQGTRLAISITQDIELPPYKD